MNGSLGMGGSLDTRVIRAPRPHTAKVLRTPFGRVILTRDKGDSLMLANGIFATNVHATHRDGDGKVIHEYDLGSGLVTNVGATALSNDWNLASPSAAAINTLKLANWHATGTGATAAAATDFKIQTISTQGGQTPVAGTQTIATTSTIAVPILQTVATISYTGSEAVTEWGLFTASTLSSTTGTPFTAANATTFTATGTPFTASSTTVQGLQQNLVIPGTTTVLGLVVSNTTSVGTLFNNGTTGWFTQAAQTAGSTPGATEAYTLRPVMWDHKVFAAINVINGDSIAFTYKLTVTSGG